MVRYTLLVIHALCVLTAAAQPAARLFELPGLFDKSLEIVSAGDGTNELYVGEKDGRLYRYDPDTGAKELVLDLAGLVDTRGEGGLLAATFHPRYPDSNYIYVNYTTFTDSPPPAVGNRVSRFTLAGPDRTALLASERVIFDLEQPQPNHNIEGIAFGPKGYLYIATGDGGGTRDEFGRAQDPLSLMGKLLRIDVDVPAGEPAYAIPADNPFVGRSDTLPEIWALGLRHPWRFSFDRQTGDLWIGDKGEDFGEEINFQAAAARGGQNYGWNCRIGGVAFASDEAHCEGIADDQFVRPRIAYTNSDQPLRGGSVTGGFRYRGPEEELVGFYIFGDFYANRLFLYDPESHRHDSLTVQLDVASQNLAAFGEGNDGSLYAVDYNGKVFRIGVRTTGILQPSVTTHRLATYPNPARGRVTISVPPALRRHSTVRLQDLTGRVYLTATVPDHLDRFDLALPQLPTGTYLLRLANTTDLAVTRMTIHGS